MKCKLLFLCLLCLLWVITGCEVSQPGTSASETTAFGGLKLSDLQDKSQGETDAEFLMSFRVLTYTIPPGSVDELQEIFGRLSRKDVRTVNKKAFEANGFAVATGSFDEGAQIAQEIARIGAIRVAQARLIAPPEKTQALSHTFLRGTETIHYATSANNSTMITPGPGTLGWVMWAKPDLRLREMAQVKLNPAYWQPGVEDMRLRMGMEPVDYQAIPVGQVLLRVEEQGFILLGPVREVPEQFTLDKLLFFLPGQRPKIQFFVIICDSVGQ